MYYDHLILYHIMQKPMHGYEIKKALEDFNRTIRGNEISNNTLYPLLSKFEKNGYITKEIMYQEGKPNRNVYKITPEGILYFYKSLNELGTYTKNNQEEFCMRLTFFNALFPRTRKKLLDEREQFLRMSRYGSEDISKAIEFSPISNRGFELTLGGLIPFYNEIVREELELIEYYRQNINVPCTIPENIRSQIAEEV